MKEVKSNSFNRRILFPLIAFSLPFLFLLLMEGVLRLTGYGESFPVFIEDKENQDYLLMNPEIGKRYFKYYAMATQGQFDVFKKEKQEGTLRVFTQGASSVVGFPYAHGLSFPRILERKLKNQFPDREIEVVNMGLAGITSQALLDQVPEIIKQQPDAVIIYAGHNEYYGTDGVGSSQTIRLPLWVKNWYQRNKFNIRILQLLRNLTFNPHRALEGKGTMMERMVEQPTIEMYSSKYEAGIRQYRNNLQQLLRKYQKAGVPVLVGSLVSNIKDQEPFISSPQQLNTDLGAASTAELLKNFEEMQKSCPGCADDFFALGRTFLKKEEYALAKEAFQMAKEADLLRFRAPDTLNSIIRQMAGQFENASYVSVLETFETQSPTGMVGSEYLLEHVHPNVSGYHLMAQTFLESLNRELLEYDQTESTGDDPFIALDSIYGEMLIQRLTNNWPFVDTFETIDPYASLELDSLDFLNRTALLYYRDEIKWIEAVIPCYEYYRKQGNLPEAIKYADALIQEIPYKEEPKSMKASALMAMKDWKGALALFQQLIPTRAGEQAIQGMAQCMVQLNDWEALKKHISSYQNNQRINPLFFKALKEIAEFELNSDPDMPMTDQINIAFAYGFIGIPLEGIALLDRLSGKFPANPDIEMARRRLSQRR